MTRTLLVSLFLFFGVIQPVNYQADIVDDLLVSFRNGNAKQVAANFAPTIELIILDEEDVYSKAQGEQILKDFFSKHSPLKATIFHKSNEAKSYRFAVITLNTNNGNFRVAITLKQAGNAFKISELKIEPIKN
ncbi:DUF4783 domain-containing protein [Pedobacter yulinensis]|uniref:DUF4783 domain-containing protein n=1 Tax=Pedobacter yulinensis TaxID=2126353 RepID=A0A2T3HH30_9SPHI|nr:DUF4783 domain-containing protein [Pedobacter yulinensis]PST81732.1 DUF4783 domain-containing protein [Pedobacter yulinensis]